MAGVGVLLMLLAAAFGAGFLLKDGETAEIDFYGLALPAFTARSLIVLGIITGLVFALGLEALRWGVSRWMRRRRDEKEECEALHKSSRKAAARKELDADDAPTQTLPAESPLPAPRNPDSDRLADEVRALRSDPFDPPSPRRRRELPEAAPR